MTHRNASIRSLATLVLAVLTAIGCEDASNGPAAPDEPAGPLSGSAAIAGRVTASVDASNRLGFVSDALVAAQDDAFIGARAVSGATVRVETSSGTATAETDGEGEFSTSVPGGTHTVELDLGGGAEFALTVTVPERARVHVNTKVDVDTQGRLRMNAEIVRDRDGDGASDDEFAIRIRGRRPNDDDSGEVEVLDPEAEDGGPATLDDLFEGQLVRVRGTWNGETLVAARVAGNCGTNDQPHELVGRVESKTADAIRMLDREIEVEGDTRFSGGAHGLADIEEGDRVVVRVEIEGEALVAVRITENGRARNGDEIVGVVDEVTEAGLTVLGVEIEVGEGTRVTSGDGCFEDEDEQEDEDEGEDEEPAGFEALAEGQQAVVVQGAFDGDRLEADHVVASTSSSRASAQVFGTVQAVDAVNRTVDVLGVTFDLASDADVVGRFASLANIAPGMRVKLELAGEGSAEVTKLNVIGGGGPDRVQGGVIESLNVGARTFEVLGIEIHAVEGAVINVE